MKVEEIESRMQKCIEAIQNNFNTVRTGRANSALLDRISVEYYGTPTPLKSMASVNTPDASTIMIQPFDRGSLGLIERAISESDIGLNPNNDGSSIRLNIPPLTSDRRKELVKTIAKLAEEGKVAIRNVRRDAMDAIKKLEKAKETSEDEAKKLQDQVEKMTEKYIKKVDQVQAEKDKEISTI